MAGGAGVLPLGTYRGEDYFLIGKEGWFFNRQWADFGGSLDGGMLAIWGAAREGYEETRGTLGSKWHLLLRLLWAKETINVHDYRAYISRWRITSLHDIPQRFHVSALKHQGSIYNEMSQLEWVRTEEIYQAAMKYRPGSGSSVTTQSGKALRSRLTAVVRRSSGYRDFAIRQVAQISMRYSDMSASHANAWSGGVPVIRLKNGRVFAVHTHGKGPQDLRLENRTWMNIKDGPSWVTRIADAVRWVFLQRPYEATTEEREAIFQALQAENIVHRLYRNAARITGAWSNATI